MTNVENGRPSYFDLIPITMSELIPQSSLFRLDDELSSALKTYAIRLLALLILFVMTLFRREMSSNHEYTSESDDDKAVIKSPSIESKINSLNVDSAENKGSSELSTITGRIFDEKKIQHHEPYAVAAHINAASQTDQNILSHLPNDSMIHLLSFLNPKDLTKMSCVSRLSQRLASDPLLWKTLLLRDYNFILTKWQIAQEAFHRDHRNARENSTIIDFISQYAEENYENFAALTSGNQLFDLKQLYFIFTKNWINWSIAGLNTPESCYIGLHNSVFDISDFLRIHPGSPDTIMVYAGKDATEIFEDLGHSNRARGIASEDLCVVNMGYDYYSQKNNVDIVSSKSEMKRLRAVSLPQSRSRKKRKKPGIINQIKTLMENEEKNERVKVKRWQKANKSLEMMGDINIYFDPFLHKWRWWYSSCSMNPVFLDSQD